MDIKPLHEILNNQNRFGKLTVISEAEPAIRKNGGKDRRVLCKCDCGNEKIIYASHLRRGNSNSCGCAIKIGKEKHGLFYHPLYSTWNAMRQRCYNPKNDDYNDYGGRGIVVCEEWRDNVAQFIADMGEKPKGYSIDRIDADGPYSKDNCRWADKWTQSRNKRSNIKFDYNGRSQTIEEICREAGVATNMVRKRIRKGWDLHNALTLPSRAGLKREIPT